MKGGVVVRILGSPAIAHASVLTRSAGSVITDSKHLLNQSADLGNVLGGRHCSVVSHERLSSGTVSRTEVAATGTMTGLDLLCASPRVLHKMTT